MAPRVVTLAADVEGAPGLAGAARRPGAVERAPGGRIPAGPVARLAGMAG